MNATAIRRRRCLQLAGGFLLAALAGGLATTAAGEIYKCTDRVGNITYQNEKCPGGGKAERVDVFDNNWTASGAEKDAQWQRNAADRRLVTGMPARWVREGFGEPAEVRETTTGGAKQLWVYNLPDRNLQIGLGDDRVIWFRETPVSVSIPRQAAPLEKSAAAAPPVQAQGETPRPIDILRAPNALAPVDTSAGAARAEAAPRPAEAARTSEPAARPADPARVADSPRAAALSPALDATRRVTRGRDCREVLAELGTPDRQRELPASDLTGTDAVTEYLYEPGGRSDGGRMRILCANGRVEGVDRSVAR